MRVLILRSTVADGGLVDAGQTVDVSEGDGRYLVANGLAARLDPEPEREPGRVVGMTTQRDPAAVHRDPVIQPARRTRR